MRQNIVQTIQARDLRQKLSGAEHMLWGLLRDRQLRGHKFRRKAALGPFIVGFLCVDRQLIVEIDHGPEPGGNPAQEAWLRAQGYHILHLWDQELLHHPQDCLSELERLLT